MHPLQRSWVRSQHPSAHWNLRGGRKQCWIKHKKKYKKSPPKNKKISQNFCDETMETTHTSSSLLIEMDTKPKATYRDDRERTPSTRLCECLSWGGYVGMGVLLPVNYVTVELVPSEYQCCGSMTFWCGSGSADPCLWLMDPDADPSIFTIDLQDANKKLI